jgi:hypothetical protein
MRSLHKCPFCGAEVSVVTTHVLKPGQCFACEETFTVTDNACENPALEETLNWKRTRDGDPAAARRSEILLAVVFAFLAVCAIGLVTAGVLIVTSRFSNPKPEEVANTDSSAKAKHDPKPEVQLERKPEPQQPEPNPEPKVTPPVGKTDDPPLGTNPLRKDQDEFPAGPAPPADGPDQPPGKLPAPNPDPANPPAVKLTFPTPRAVEIKPAPLDRDTTEVKLTGTVTDAVVGGGGRYWCLLLSDQKQIAIFDVNQAKVVKSIPLAGGDVLVAAGMNKLLVVYPHLEVIVRYDLGTFEKEVTAKLALRGSAKQICLGAASAGPMLVFGGRKYDLVNAPVTFLDIQSLKELDPGKDEGRLFFMSTDRTAHFRASPDGRLYGAWTTSVTPTGLYGLVASETGLKSYHEHESAGSVVPTPDGHLVTQLGVFTSELKPVGGKDREKERFKNWTSGVRVPAHQGDWYLTVQPEKANDEFALNPKRATKVTVHRTGEAQAIMSLGDIGITLGSDEWTRGDLTRDKRVLFSPAGGLIAWIGPANDKLHLRKFDAQAELDKTGVDYLLVTSTAPSAELGASYKYTPVVKSKKGDVKFKLSAGPDGMKVAAGGTLTWTPPKDWKGGDGVILTVSDKSGQEVFHTFELTKAAPPAKEDPPVAVKPPVPNPEPDPPVKPPVEPKPGLVRAPANPTKFTPTKAADKAEVKLPGTVDATCLGGNGRYVLLRIPKVKQIAVLDVCEGKIVKYLALAEEASLFAAGNEHVFVVAPVANTIQRWNLNTFEKEPAVANPIGTAPRVALMGHATDGPLFIGGPAKDGVGLLDGKTLKKLEVPGDGWKPLRGDFYTTRVRISADGRVFGHWNPRYTPSGLRTLVLSDEGVKSYDEHESVGSILPGPDGTLFTSSGLYSPDLKPVNDKHGYWEALPPAHGRVYLAVSGPTDKTEAKVTVRLIGETRPLAELGNLAGLDLARPDPFARDARVTLPVSDRVFLVPNANALVVLNGNVDKVIIHKAEVEALLEKAGIDYLYVTSRPGVAKCGATFTYKPDVKSKKGGVTIKLDIGPEGMRTTADGTLAWKVPENFADTSVSVLLTVSDKSGQETFHMFTLPVQSRP